MPVDVLSRQLDDLASVLFRIEPEIYTRRPESGLSGSIGGHMRHVLDHLAALIDAGPRELTYDNRRRGTPVETDPIEALSEICRLKSALARLVARRPDEPVRVESQIAPDGRSIRSWSTLGRELAFVMHHTIHHQAMIALLLSPRCTSTLPERFGYAPSTPTPA